MSFNSERRFSPRRNTTIQAFIVHNAGRARVPCIIRNMSDSGAKLEVASVAGIPNTFDLLVAGKRPYQCRVIWRTLKEMGIEYRQT